MTRDPLSAGLNPAEPAGVGTVQHSPPRLLFGIGVLAQLGEEVGRLGARPMAVTSPNTSERHAGAQAEASLTAAGIPPVWSTAVPPEPDASDAHRAAEQARQAGADVIVGIGGGSAMDVAKLCAVLAVDPGPVERWIGPGRIGRRGLPVVLVPTTAGSGSEVTHEAVLRSPEAGTKFAVKDPWLVADCAVVDPAATASCPPGLTAATGMDAFTHALEAYTNLRANPLSDLHASAAIVELAIWLPVAVEDGGRLDAREHTAFGSMQAGLAFASTGTAAVHACGYPLSARYGIAHGAANALMLPHVVAASLEAHPRYAGLAELLGTDDLPGFLRRLCETVGLPTRLRDIGVRRPDLPELGAVAARDDRHLTPHPRRLSAADLTAIFAAAW